MESRARYMLVGAVVLLINAILTITLLWLGAQRDDADSRFYTVYFRKFSLAGLQVNSWVTMRGIKVGVVEKMQISRRDIELIKVSLRLQKDTPVKHDTEAVIERNLLTGLASIDLVKSTQESPLLEETAHEEFPVIPEGRTTLGTIQDNLPQLFDKVSQISNRLNALISPENEKALSETLANLRALSSELEHHKAEFTQAISNVNALTADTRTLIQGLDIRSKEVAQSVTGASEAMTLEMSRIGQALSSTAEAIRVTLEGYEEPGTIIRGRAASARGPGEERR